MVPMWRGRWRGSKNILNRAVAEEVELFVPGGAADIRPEDLDQ